MSRNRRKTRNKDSLRPGDEGVVEDLSDTGEGRCPVREEVESFQKKPGTVSTIERISDVYDWTRRNIVLYSVRPLSPTFKFTNVFN